MKLKWINMNKKFKTFLIFHLFIILPLELRADPNIIIDALWNELGWEVPSPVSPEKDTIVEPTPSPTISPKKEIPNPEPTPIKSKGQLAIEKMKQKNKEEFEKRKEEFKSKKEEEKETDIISLSKKRHKEFLEQSTNGLKELKTLNAKTLKNWKQNVSETYQKWAEERKVFLSRISDYKENTFNLQSEATTKLSPKTKMKKPLTKAIKDEYFIIPNALNLSPKDQGKRPTCAAFSAIRAIETVLNVNSNAPELSEQYFYYSSKPKCQTFPCKNKGSWVAAGFEKSIDSNKPDIPLEKDCPYNLYPLDGNETQIPLQSGCKNGKVKVKNISSFSTLNEILIALKKNRPVIAGFTLSPNFYDSNGLVTLEDSQKSGNMDAHANGHALVIIGHMKLPTSRHKKEGKVCFIVANSWSEGWGKGGFGCLTENWVLKYRVRNPFISVDNVAINL